MKKTIVVVGTLDTKGAEISFIANQIREKGYSYNIETLVIDSGILDQPRNIVPDITREQVASAAKTSIDLIKQSKSRGEALSMMSKGITEVVKSLYEKNKCHCLVSIAGASGASLVKEAMEILPIGIPKILATPLASGTRHFSFFLDTKDVMIMHSVIDILGVNTISVKIFDNIVGSAIGSVLCSSNIPSDSKRVGITMLGNTTKGIMRLKTRLDEKGYEPIIYHSSGIGGKSMERMAKEGWFHGIIDYTTNEVFEDIVGGLQQGAGPDRLSIVGVLGIPQVVVPGCIDFFDQGPIETIPSKWRNRPLYKHSPSFTLVRLNKKEMSSLGKLFASKLNQSNGPTTVVVPLNGLSMPNYPGGIFWDEEADRAFLKSLKNKLRQDIEVVEVEAHINDSIFADIVFEQFLSVMKE